MGISKYLIENKLVAADFLQNYTENYGQFSQKIRETSWQEIEESCGLNYTGSYSINISASGNGGIKPNDTATLYINYTKPSNGISASWRVKHFNWTDYNVSIPSGCFNQNNLQFLPVFLLHNLL